MSRNRIVVFLLLILVCVVSGAYIVYNSQDTYSAGNLSISVSGATLNVGETKTLTIKTSPDTASADGNVISNDPTCIEIVQVKSGTGGKTTSFFAAFDSSGDGITSAGTITIKALRNCSTTLTLKNVTMSDTNLVEYRGLSFTSGSIKVVEPTTKATTVATQPTTQVQQTTSKQAGSNNNLLSSLRIDGYDLDRKFNSSVTNYVINVQSAVKSLTVDAKAQDKNAKVSIQGNDSIKSGTNNINIIVTAEDGSKKTYRVKVIKEIDPNEEPEIKGVEVTTEQVVEEPQSTTNTYLKELVVKNGKLDKEFNKKVHTYYFSKKYSNLTIEKAIPEIEENEVTTYKIDGGYVIMVENELGERGFYLLIEKESFLFVILIISIILLLIIIICLIIYFSKKINILKNKR